MAGVASTYSATRMAVEPVEGIGPRRGLLVDKLLTSAHVRQPRAPDRRREHLHRTGIAMRARIENVRVPLPALLAVGVVAAAVAGCGGGAGGGGYGAVGSGASRPTTATHQPAQTAPATVASAGIPQRNGGDMDADNNGGPSDGDGNQ